MTIHFDFLMEVDVNGTMIGAFYRRLDVAVFDPWKKSLGDKDIINLKVG